MIEPMHQPMRLGELLLRAGVVTELQLRAALAEQKRWGGKLGTVLVRMGALSEDLLVKALSKQLGIPRANLAEVSVPKTILDKMGRKLCEEHTVLPLSYIQERRALQVAVSDPFNVVLLDDLSRRTGVRVEPALAGEGAIREAIAKVFGGAVDESVSGREPGMKLLNNQMTSLLEQTPVKEGRRIPTVVDRVAQPMIDKNLAELTQMAEHQERVLRTVLEILVERGVLQPDDIKRLG